MISVFHYLIVFAEISLKMKKVTTNSIMTATALITFKKIEIVLCALKLFIAQDNVLFHNIYEVTNIYFP